MRFSTREPAPWPTMRKPRVRLSRPQPTAVGAHEPGWKRLYELIVGAHSRESSRASASCPPSHQRNVSLIPCGAPASCNTLTVPSAFHNEEWMWHDDPVSSRSYFAMNDTDRPCSAAISLAAVLYRWFRSAISTAVV